MSSHISPHAYFYEEAENYGKVEMLCSVATKRDQSPPVRHTSTKQKMELSLKPLALMVQ